MKLTGENRQLGEKPVPVPLCPPQTPRGLTRDRTRASAVEGRRLTASAMARPIFMLILIYFYFIYVSLYLYFPPFLSLYSIHVFPSALADYTPNIVSIHPSLSPV
jgi:hypothetical protein